MMFDQSAENMGDSKQTLLLMQKFQTMAEQVPQFPVTFRDVQIDCKALREQLLLIPRTIMSKV
jgi:hypothetical protein